MTQLLGAMALAVTLLLAAFYLAPWRGALTLEPSPEALASAPDLHMTQSSISQFDEAGALLYQLQAEQLTHFAAQAETRLRQPRLVLHQADAAPWQVSAVTGLMRQDRSASGMIEHTIDLNGDVALHHDLQDAGFVRLQALHLRVLPERRSAETRQGVVIESHAGHSRGDWLEADLVRKLLILGANPDGRVQTTIVPQRRGAVAQEITAANPPSSASSDAHFH